MVDSVTHNGVTYSTTIRFKEDNGGDSGTIGIDSAGDLVITGPTLHTGMTGFVIVFPVGRLSTEIYVKSGVVATRDS